MSFRRDDADIRLDKATKLDNGWLRLDAVIGRVGVLEYTRPDGSTFREYRPAEEVFHADSLASFDLVPATNEHPPSRLDATNAKAYAIGTVGNVRQDGDLIRAEVLVIDAQAIRDIESGKRQLSPGYQVRPDPTPGEFGGQRYDAVQRGIRGNHVALVDRGRQGPEVGLRMDSGDAFASTLRQDSQTMKIKLGDREYDVTEVKAALAQAEAQPAPQPAPAANPVSAPAPAPIAVGSAAAPRQDADAAALRAERDALKERLDRMESESKARFGERVQLYANASRICGADYRSDGKDDLQVMADVVLAVDPGAKPALEANAKSEGYIKARYDMALEASKARANYGKTLLDAAAGAGRSDAELSPLEKAKAARDQRLANDAMKARGA
jgi:uncharacterized protein